MKNIKTKELNNGYVYLFNEFRLFKEHEIYVVCGFDKLNKHFYSCFQKLSEAKEKIKNTLNKK